MAWNTTAKYVHALVVLTHLCMAIGMISELAQRRLQYYDQIV